MNKSEEFIELRSEEVQELLTRVPSWLLRWGILVIFLVIALVFWGTWLIQYPDLIKAPFKLVSTNAPKVLLARTDGKLVRLFTQEGEIVQAGAVLAYLESNAQHEEVLRLSTELEKAWPLANKNKFEDLDRLNLENYYKLGELQTAFHTFKQQHHQLQAYLANGFYAKKKYLLKQEISDLKLLAENLRKQQLIQEHDMKLAQEEYNVQRQLTEQKDIALLELKREEIKNFARKLPYQQTASSLISNLSAQRVIQKELLELDKQVAEQLDNFLQALNTLQSAAEAWKTKYVVIAPVSGRSYFSATLQENQYLKLNQELLYIAPPTNNYFGELGIPQQNAGKVRIGQDVLVKFAGYPYQEFGTVRGKITYIAEIPMKDSVFIAKVALPTGLKTSYGKRLAYKTGMSASADIVTEDSRLFHKLFYQFRKMANGR